MFTKPFTKLTSKNVDEAGGKGASLGEMTKAKIAVPPGFVVVAQAFDRFLDETDLGVEIQAVLEEQVNVKDTNSVEDASEKIRDMIHDVKFPTDIGDEVEKEFKKLRAKFVAVRSSATAEDSSIASWAGELESYLNTTDKTLIKNVKSCWSSLFTPRAIFYRFENKLDKTQVSVAVVVQKMIQSEISGICFTVHPITKDRNQMVIEAGFGLGEAIVSGSITPDTYIIDKRDFSILDINIADQKKKIERSPSMKVGQGKSGNKWVPVKKADQDAQKLEGKKIVELAKLCAKIEKHYKSPQDIEWAMERNKLYIVQSRPITTL